MKSLSIKTLIIIGIGLLTQQAIAAQPVKPFSATYEASYSGMPITATRELVAIDASTVKITSEAKSWLGNIKETSTFEVKQDHLEPLAYEYARTGLGKNKTLKVEFDPACDIIKSDNNGEKKVHHEAKQVFDPLTYQLQLQADLADKKDTFSYQIADGKRIKQYDFDLIGNETIVTPIGPLKTTRVERVKANSDKKTIIWFADDWDYLIVKIDRIEDDKEYSINLVKATVDGQTVTKQSSLTLGKNNEN